MRLIMGEKTILRAAELEDARIISAWLNDRETNEFLDIIYPISKRYADSFIMDADENQNKKIFIIDNMERKPIGIITIDKIKWEYRNCEIGIVIYDKKERRKGYAKDAIKTALDFIFNDMNMHIVYLNVVENNEAAINLYLNVGFKKEGILRDRYFKSGRYYNIIVMSMINWRESNENRGI
ncbi:GNAT family N-acetyltransferase [Caloramator sp. E03]|uniref:GNAT family N-acetyltransferase n=1 Tax=Caloramator sp. E03 TaxID=2576307 RepID=UPI0011105CC8|nr:GNAT family protein [Caloramator sp. E03]QCX32926.1 GNAT family N-acetyltransferase [Caloramator sp. E03]